MAATGEGEHQEPLSRREPAQSSFLLPTTSFLKVSKRFREVGVNLCTRTSGQLHLRRARIAQPLAEPLNFKILVWSALRETGGAAPGAGKTLRTDSECIFMSIDVVSERFGRFSDHL